jgi:hypothetical protein
LAVVDQIGAGTGLDQPQQQWVIGQRCDAATWRTRQLRRDHGQRSGATAAGSLPQAAALRGASMHTPGWSLISG